MDERLCAWCELPLPQKEKYAPKEKFTMLHKACEEKIKEIGKGKMITPDGKRMFDEEEMRRQ